MEEILRNTAATDWATFILVACVLMLAISKTNNPTRFQEFLQLSVTDKYFFLQGKESALMTWFQLFIMATQVLSFSLFLFLGIELFFNETFSEVDLLFPKVVLGYSLFTVIKLLVEKFIGLSFAIEKEINSYVFQKMSYKNLLALLLLIGNALLIYTFPAHKILWMIFAILALILYLTFWFFILKSRQKNIANHLFYFILYLCALEISPYLILYKILI